MNGDFISPNYFLPSKNMSYIKICTPTCTCCRNNSGKKVYVFEVQYVDEHSIIKVIVCFLFGMYKHVVIKNSKQTTFIYCIMLLFRGYS